jgi:hypothetical protein
MSRPEAKWIGIAGFIDATKRTVGAPSWARAAETLPAATKGLLAAPPSPITWVDAEHAFAVYDAIVMHAAAGRNDVLREIAREQVQGDLRGIYRLFVRLASAEFIAHRAASLYGSYWRGLGTVRAERSGSRSFDVLYEDVPRVRLVFMAVQLGGIEAALVASGLEGVRVNVVQTSEHHVRARAMWA